MAAWRGQIGKAFAPRMKLPHPLRQAESGLMTGGISILVD